MDKHKSIRRILAIQLHVSARYACHSAALLPAAARQWRACTCTSHWLRTSQGCELVTGCELVAMSEVVQMLELRVPAAGPDDILIDVSMTPPMMGSDDEEGAVGGFVGFLTL